jgi:hypothetical protein
MELRKLVMRVVGWLADWHEIICSAEKFCIYFYFVLFFRYLLVVTYDFTLRIMSRRFVGVNR